MSQKARLNGYAVYVFDDKFDSYYDVNNYYEGKFKGGLQWGVGLEYMAQAAQGIELLYLNQSTNAPTTYLQGGQIGGVKTTNFDVGFNWIMLAGNRYIRKPGSKVEGFGGFMAGAVIINVENPAIPANKTCTPIKRLTPMPVPILKIKSRAASKHMIPAITVIHRNGSCFLNTNPSSMKCKPRNNIHNPKSIAIILVVENKFRNITIPNPIVRILHKRAVFFL